MFLIKAAYKYENKLVRQRCIEYFINHAKEIIGVHELWKKFADEEPDIVSDLLYWLVNKDGFYAKKTEWESLSYWE